MKGSYPQNAEEGRLPYSYLDKNPASKRRPREPQSGMAGTISSRVRSKVDHTPTPSTTIPAGLRKDEATKVKATVNRLEKYVQELESSQRLRKHSTSSSERKSIVEVLIGLRRKFWRFFKWHAGFSALIALLLVLIVLHTTKASSDNRKMALRLVTNPQEYGGS